VSKTAATGMPKLETGPQKSALSQLCFPVLEITPAQQSPLNARAPKSQGIKDERGCTVFSRGGGQALRTQRSYGVRAREKGVNVEMETYVLSTNSP
jgi:hypothetical protein